VSNALGIWPVRLEAERLARRLAQRLGAEVFRPWEREETHKAQFQAQFGLYSHWVLIMAAGIATRFVDGLLRSKHQDPAVVVLDEGGRYAIALLGGHEAGANSLAYRVANAVGAIPVVTTATEAVRPFVVGVGCRKGIGEEQLAAAIRHALGLCGRQARSGDASACEQGNLALGNVGAAAEFSCVRELVTVDLKADEPALVAFSQRYGIPLRVIGRHQIEARSWVTRPSQWVRQSVGLDGVCEPCALIACGRGRLVVPKTTLNGVAVAVVEDDWGFAA
jgi:cobalt-precorrin 5A hydrolase